jgi:UDP-glucose 6-dehydrogenase
MSTTAAELVKLAVNCFLTTKISYANMVGEVMTLAGLEDEISTVLTAIGDDSRVGRKYLNYGYGFGGPCLPRDNRSFAAYAKKLGLEYNLGATTDNFNDEHARFLLEYFVKKNDKNLPFCFHYASYKEGTDIITESQQYRLCLDLLDNGYKVYVVEDYVKSQCDDRIIFGIPNEEVFWVEL